MNEFEEQLKQALARRAPSADFTARVLELAANQPKFTIGMRLRLWLRETRSWRVVPVMATLLLIVGATIYEQHEHVARGEAAKDQLLAAMRIAGLKLHHTQHRVFDIENEEVSQ